MEANERWRRLLSYQSAAVEAGRCFSGRPDEMDTMATVDLNEPLENNEREEAVWEEWGKIVKNWKGPDKRVAELTRRGIPRHFRPIIWQLMCDAVDADEKKLYNEYIKKKSPYERVIRRDIARAHPEHDLFKSGENNKQEALFNVVKAYTIYDKGVGYCQGSAFIAAILIMLMPEEEAFAVLAKIMRDYKMKDMYQPSLNRSEICMYQFDHLLSRHLPDLHGHFRAQDLSPSAYASAWFTALFAATFPFELACRVLDVFFVSGVEIVFRVGLAALALVKDRLMGLGASEILGFLQSDLVAVADADHERLMRCAYHEVGYDVKDVESLERRFREKRIDRGVQSSEINVSESVL